jgi:hypothetical protein
MAKSEKIGVCLCCTNTIYKTRSGKYVGHATMCKNYRTSDIKLDNKND